METQELSVLEEKIDTLVQYCRELRNDNAELRAALGRKSDEADTLRARVNEYDDMRENVRERINNLVHTIDELERGAEESREANDTGEFVQNELPSIEQNHE